MKKILLFALCFAVAGLISCTKKKDSLVANTLTIAVNPSIVNVSTGASINISAICRSAQTDNASVSPIWTVDNALGSFSPASGKTTKFTAAAGSGKGKIYASYSGIKGSGNLTVVASTSTSGVDTSVYGIYSETYVNPGYNMMKYDTANPPDIDGGCIGLYGGCINNVNSVAGAGYGGTKALECSAVGSAGGLWIQFGSDSTSGYNGATDIRVQKNMSSFSGGNLRFDIKMTADVTVDMEWGTLGAASHKASSMYSLGYPTDNSWHSVVIPLSSFTSDLTQIQVPVEFYINTGTVFYVDNIRWTTN